MRTILLIHGWDYQNYYHKTNKSAWSNRQVFVDELKKSYNVCLLDLPGFGFRKEPCAKSWDLSDFANFINEYIKSNNLKIDYILGYSFGGAVAVQYKKEFNKKIKLILVSPALIRNNDKSKKFIKTPKCLNFIRNSLRDYYLIHIVKNKEMMYGTKFLRNTYQNIVRIDLLSTLESLNYRDIIIIYGKLDMMVNPSKVISTVSKNYQKRINVIEGGSHNIAVTHTKELVEIINNFINK